MIENESIAMRASYKPLLGLLTLHVTTAIADGYASNTRPVVLDAPQVAANFPNVEGIQLLSPAFIHPENIPATFANGTSGPTPQQDLGMLNYNSTGGLADHRQKVL
jgi:hypothetical protein